MIYWYIRYDSRTLTKIMKSLRTVNDGLYFISGYSIDNLKKVNSIFMEENLHSSLINKWDEFYYSFKSIMGSGRCPVIEDYFNVTGIITIPAHRKKVEMIPGLLIALGVLGTFAGIILGPAGIGFPGSNLIQINIETLMNGLATSLLSSVAGIAAAVVFQLMDRRIFNKAIQQLHMFRDKMEMRIPTSKNTQYMELMLNEQKQIGKDLKNIANEVTGKLHQYIVNDLLPVTTKTYEEALKNYVSPSIDQMNEAIERISVAATTVQSENMQIMADSFLDRLNASISEYTGRFAQNIVNISDKLEMAGRDMHMLLTELNRTIVLQNEVNSSSESFIKVVAQYNKDTLQMDRDIVETLENAKNMAVSMNEFVNSSKESLERLEQQREAMRNDYDDYFRMMGDQVSHVGDDLRFNIESILSRFSDVAGGTFDKMESHIGAAVSKLENIVNNLLVSIDEQIRNISLYANEMHGGMDMLNTNFKSTVAEFNEKVHIGIIATFEDFDKGMSEITARFGQVAGEIRDALGGLPKAIGALKEKMDNAVRDGK